MSRYISRRERNANKQLPRTKANWKLDETFDCTINKSIRFPVPFGVSQRNAGLARRSMASKHAPLFPKLSFDSRQFISFISRRKLFLPRGIRPITLEHRGNRVRSDAALQFRLWERNFCAEALISKARITREPYVNLLPRML